MKLGEDTIAKIKGTALDRADEMDALIKLNRGAAPGTLTKDVQQLVEDAAAGKNVSAIAYTAKIRGRSAPSRVSKTTRDNIGPASTGEIEEAKEVRKTEDEGEDSELNLLRAWDCASQGAREKFKAHVGLVAVEPPAKAMDDGLDIPEFLRRAAP